MASAVLSPAGPVRLAHVAVPVLALATLLPAVSSAVALMGGITLALTVGNPWPAVTRTLSRRGLVWCVVGLGAGMDLAVVGRVGLNGLGTTALGIAGSLTLGLLLGRRLGI